MESKPDHVMPLNVITSIVEYIKEDVLESKVLSLEDKITILDSTIKTLEAIMKNFKESSSHITTLKITSEGMREIRLTGKDEEDVIDPREEGIT